MEIQQEDKNRLSVKDDLQLFRTFQKRLSRDIQADQLQIPVLEFQEEEDDINQNENLEVNNKEEKKQTHKYRSRLDIVFNQIHDFFDQDQINKSIQQLKSLKDRQILIDKILKRRAEVENSMQFVKMTQNAPFINKFINKLTVTIKSKDDSKQKSNKKQISEKVYVKPQPSNIFAFQRSESKIYHNKQGNEDPSNDQINDPVSPRPQIQLNDQLDLKLDKNENSKDVAEQIKDFVKNAYWEQRILNDFKIFQMESKKTKSRQLLRDVIHFSQLQNFIDDSPLNERSNKSILNGIQTKFNKQSIFQLNDILDGKMKSKSQRILPSFLNDKKDDENKSEELKIRIKYPKVSQKSQYLLDQGQIKEQERVTSLLDDYQIEGLANHFKSVQSVSKPQQIRVNGQIFKLLPKNNKSTFQQVYDKIKAKHYQKGYNSKYYSENNDFKQTLCQEIKNFIKNDYTNQNISNNLLNFTQHNLRDIDYQAIQNLKKGESFETEQGDLIVPKSVREKMKLNDKRANTTQPLQSSYSNRTMKVKRPNQSGEYQIKEIKLNKQNIKSNRLDEGNLSFASFTEQKLEQLYNDQIEMNEKLKCIENVLMDGNLQFRQGGFKEQGLQNYKKELKARDRLQNFKDKLSILLRRNLTVLNFKN